METASGTIRWRGRALSFFRAIAWGAEVGSGDNAAAYCTLTGVAKLNGTEKPLMTANEFIAFRLGQLVGLPTVPGVVVGGADKTGWVSLRFGDRNEKPPPILPHEVVAEMPDVSAGTIVFDCWIGNADRHDENLAMVGDSLYLFDHDRALLAEGKRAAPYAAHGLDRHCLAAHLLEGEYLDGWIREIEAIKDRPLIQIVTEAVTENALPAGRKDEVVALLQYRRNQVRTILKAARDAGCFKKLIQWPLFLT